MILFSAFYKHFRMSERAREITLARFSYSIEVMKLCGGSERMIFPVMVIDTNWSFGECDVGMGEGSSGMSIRHITSKIFGLLVTTQSKVKNSVSFSLKG